MQFFRLLIIIVLAYYLVKLLRNLYYAAFKQNEGNKSKASQYKQGNVTIDYIPPRKNKISKEEAEVIDFEEVK
jgi:hypothetical protein